MAVRINTAFAEAYYNQGNALKDKSDFHNAKECYQKAINLKPDDANAHHNLARVLKDLVQLDLVINSYRQALNVRSEFAEAYNNLGIALKDNGELEAARASYRKAIDWRPNFFGAHNNLGTVWLKRGELDLAVACFRDAVAITPTLVALYNLGIALQNLGSYAESENVFTSAIELFAHDPAAATKLQKAQSYLLRSLYLLGDRTRFCAYVTNLVGLGQRNALIGSYCIFAHIKLDTSFENPFCNRPLDYVLEENLSENFYFNGLFIRPALKAIGDKKISRRDHHLIVNGYQASGNILEGDSFFLTRPKKLSISQ